MASEADPVLIHRVETLERRTDRHGEMLDNLTNAMTGLEQRHASIETNLRDIRSQMQENQSLLIRWLLGVVGAATGSIGLMGVL